MAFNSRFKDLMGERFGRLLVIGYHGKDKHSHNLWLCKCDCGNFKLISTGDLTKGKTKSCGCLAKELTVKRNTTHGGTHSRLYGIYNKMLWRCNNPKCKYYSYYGLRGIKVCSEWNEFINFRNWALSNGYKDNLTLDRIDNNGDYEPSNCRWVTRKRQAENKRNTIFITIDGVKKPLSVWAKEKGVCYITAYRRYSKGLSANEIFG